MNTKTHFPFRIAWADRAPTDEQIVSLTMSLTGTN
jgi:hypothetical protein